MSYRHSERTTIRLTSSRSYAELAQAINKINENLYADDMFVEDRIEFRDIYAADGSLSHFEVDGTPLDFFHLGMRLGELEEKRYRAQLDALLGK